MLQPTVLVILANLMPTLEQVGGIPLGLSLGLSPVYVFLLSASVNCLLFFPIYFGLKFFYKKIFSRIGLFNRYLERIRRKGKPYIEKYGVVGLTLFISLPTPLTGTYTASILSWFLDLNWKKSFLAIMLGSFIGGLVVLGAVLGFSEVLKIIFAI